MSHTPGPWELIDEPRNRYYRDAPGDWEATLGQHCWYIAGPVHDSHFVADIITTVLDSEGDANARIIAAAPELLAELEHMLFHHGPRNPEEAKTEVRAKAVIAKARGETRQ